MIDKSTRKQLAERKERVRRRINTKVDPENYEFIPAKKPIDYYGELLAQHHQGYLVAVCKHPLVVDEFPAGGKVPHGQIDLFLRHQN